MLESIISPDTAERNPWDMVILGVVVSSIGVWIGYYLGDIIGAPASMLALAIIVMALAPLMHRVLVVEEKREEYGDHSSPIGFITRHMDVIFLYSFLFVGLFASFCFWYVFLPTDSDTAPSSNEMFGLQEQGVQSVQKSVSGTGAAVVVGQEMTLTKTSSQPSEAEEADLRMVEQVCNPAVPRAKAEVSIQVWKNRFSSIFSNNMRVMAFAFLASFLFGAGAIWLITWNASTIAVFVGMKIKASIFAGASPAAAYLAGFPMYSLSMAAWAIPELIAYFAAAIAGGIISVGVARHHLRSEKFWLVVFDGILFLFIAFALVIAGAFIEHFFVSVPCPM